MTPDANDAIFVKFNASADPAASLPTIRSWPEVKEVGLAEKFGLHANGSAVCVFSKKGPVDPELQGKLQRMPGVFAVMPPVNAL